MTKKRIPTGLSGILALDKPAGITSHDVVNVVRNKTGERRVGHAGTLDPMATGLLMVCVGPATRLADYLMASIKNYEVRICFGTATNTDDAEGEVVAREEVPAELQNEAFAQRMLAAMQGELLQVPPAFSAIKKDGLKAYQAARKGEALELEARKVHLYEVKLLAAGKDYWDVELLVSKGFYVRSFARDLGAQLNSAAHVGALRRTGSGSINVCEAARLEDLEGFEKSAELEGQKLPLGVHLPFIDPVSALGLPSVEINPFQARDISNGASLSLDSSQRVSGSLVSVVCEGSLLALCEQAGSSGLLKPKVVIPGGVSLGA